MKCADYLLKFYVLAFSRMIKSLISVNLIKYKGLLKLYGKIHK